jgi:hypothetical protein
MSWSSTMISGAWLWRKPAWFRAPSATCEGRAGVVVAIEASCLAGNGRDWHALIEFCGLIGAIIIDEDGIYEPRSTSQTSAFFCVPDLAIDEIADIVAILFLFLEKCIVAGFNLDIVVRRGRDSVLACIGFLKRNHLRYRPRLAFILIGHRRVLGRARAARPEQRSRISGM